ncbi:TetR family transcriptional regulator [Clostridium estertheticum]|uniref:TetR family transcriptional regulator n=1 Tax=Clostridium estertheticum TaxID=238834 RepID=UPI00128D11DA
MQVIKEAIKNRIDEAALKEFLEYGFEKATMRAIAKSSGISAGNIYCYYKNKEDILDVLISPFYNYIKKSIYSESTSYNNLNNFLAELIYNYKSHIIILIDGCKGSKYENVKDDLISLVKNHLKKDVFKTYANKETEVSDFVINIITHNYIDGLLMIAKKFNSKEWDIKVINDLVRFYFKDCEKRLI